jgi:hypothetical protein
VTQRVTAADVMRLERYVQIVNGISYDTAQAEIAACVYDEQNLDWDYAGIKHYLMRKVDDTFFLFELIGFMQKRPVGKITPMTKKEALGWCEGNGVDVDTIERLFKGEHRHATGTETLSLLTSRWARIPPMDA